MDTDGEHSIILIEFSLFGRNLSEATEFCDGFWIVFYLESHHYIIVEPDASTLADDENGCGLLAA